MSELVFVTFYVLLPALFVGERWGRRLDGIAQHVLGWRSPLARSFLIAAAYVVAYWALLIPLRAVIEYLPQRAAEVRHQPFADWLAENAWDVVWYAPHTIIPCMVAVWALGRWPRRWWIPVWIAYSLGVAAATLLPDLGFGTSTSQVPLQDPEMVAVIERVAQQAGLPRPDIVVVQSSRVDLRANAYANELAGRPVIAFDDNLLSVAEPESVSWIAAHELGHFALGHGRMRLARDLSTAVFVLWLTSVLAPRILRRHGESLRIDSLASPAAIPLLLLVSSVLVVLAEPGGRLLSRQEERAADSYARALLSDASACRNALRWGGAADDSAVARLYSAHPPIAERLASCEAR